MITQAQPTIPHLPDANQQLLYLCVEDQWDRGFDKYGNAKRSDYELDWSFVTPRDVERRQQVRTMLAEGRIIAAIDFEHAAWILQHGDKPDDYLLAHVLATTAIILGQTTARWIAAATLDRYLCTTKSDQLFGTQYFPASDGNGYEPGSVKPNVVTDAIRVIWEVPKLDDRITLS